MDERPSSPTVESTGPTVESTGPTVESTGPDDLAPLEEEGLVEEDLLLEDVSIDGMCGVY